MPLNAVTKIPALAFVGVMEVIASSRYMPPGSQRYHAEMRGFFKLS